MDHDALRLFLRNYDQKNIKEYVSTVITDTGLPIYGIPMSQLRREAKRLSAGNWRVLFSGAKWDSFEEVLLLGLTLAYAKEDFSQKLPVLHQLLPRLDSWAHTDAIVPTLRIREAERETAWAFALECLGSDLEYTVRFGIVMLMDYFLTADKIDVVLDIFKTLRDQRYYVRMAAAWCLAEAAVRYPAAVEQLLRTQELDCFIHNKTIQKMRESYRISAEQKAAVKLLKRKE